MLNYLKIRITLAGTPLVALEGGGVCEKFKMFFLGGGGRGGEVGRMVIPSPNIVTNLPKPISSYKM